MEAPHLRFLLRKLLLRTMPCPLPVGTNLLYWDRSSSEFAYKYIGGLYERQTRVLVQGLLPPGGTFLDIGANIGYFSIVAAKKVGRNGKVYAFEPNPRVLPLLAKNIFANRLSDRVIIVPRAVSDTDHYKIKFYMDLSENINSSMFEFADRTTLETSALTISLDTFTDSRKIQRIDLLKMDIEGGELRALHGMINTSARFPSMKLIVELSPGILEKMGVSTEEFFKTLRELGFSRYLAIGSDMLGYWKPRPVDSETVYHYVPASGYVNILCMKS